MKWFIAVVFAVVACGVTRASAADTAGCDASVDFSSPAALVQALKPQSAEQIAACPSRGIRYAPVGANTPAPASAPAHQATAPDGVAGISLPILFETGSATLTADARPLVEALGKALGSPELKSYRFRIEGHTDTVGTAAYNLDLSRQRAETVAHVLEDQYKIDPARLQTVGFGFDRPLVADPPGTPEAKNRRVQVINLGAS